MDSIRVARGDRGGTRPPLVLPSHLMDESVLISDEARTGGMFLMAPTGWGKSRFLGAQCYQDLLRGVGTVVLDAVGGTIDNLLNNCCIYQRRSKKSSRKRLSTAIWQATEWGIHLSTHMSLPGRCFTN